MGAGHGEPSRTKVSEGPRTPEAEQKTSANPEENSWGGRGQKGGHKNYRLLLKANKDKGRKKQRETIRKVWPESPASNLGGKGGGAVAGGGVVEQVRGSGEWSWGANTAPVGKGGQWGRWAGTSARVVISK